MDSRTSSPAIQTLAGRQASGFTLVEILVVISIIAILAGLSMAMILRGGETGRISAEESRIARLVLAARNYETEAGDYPPSSLADAGIAGVDAVNAGIESLLAHLQSRRNGGPFIDDVREDERGNTDADVLTAAQQKLLVSRLQWGGAGTQLFELIDAWGNPYVYLHNRDYGRGAKVRSSDGQVFDVRGAKDPETGGFANPTSFQLWSLGPDGLNENGEGDDIASWKS